MPANSTRNKLAEAINLANSLTVLRVVLIPGFIIALEYDRPDIAMYIFIVAMVSDFIDGPLARIRGTETELGAFLDPLADKFIIITSFVLFASYGWIPEWLTIVVISRDIVVVTGWLLIYLIYRTLAVKPLLLGKVAIFFQFTTILFSLARINYDFMPDLLTPLVWLTAGFTVMSGLQYVHRGLSAGKSK